MLQKTTINPRFRNIFASGYIGRLWVKNRLVRSPMNTQLATPDGCVTERLAHHYRELARGGVGLVIVEFAYVDEKASKAAMCQLGASRNEHQPGLGWLAKTVKDNGAKACLQIVHAGKQKFLCTPPIKAASRVPWEELLTQGAPVPEELTIEEIQEIMEAFGRAALRAKLVGFDMVEVHGAHGYLVTDFLSPHTNKRADWYGGSLKNRMRFLLGVVENIRKQVGADYPLSVRLSGTDYEDDGITIDETKQVAKALEKVGVNIIHVSGGYHHMMDRETVPMYWPLAYNVWAAEEVKKAVNIPVIASGSITSPELAEKVLQDGKADFIGLGRPLIADPYFPLKALEDRCEDICPCIRCGEGCQERGVNIRSIHCAVNVAVGREEELRLTPVAKPKKVAVVGGGPAGMEAARVAAVRGHVVTLFEKRELGGMLIEASYPEFKADIRALIKYLSTQVEKTGVNLIMSEATAETIKNGEFDAVIVATGGNPRMPNILGVDKSFVIGWQDVLHGYDVGQDVIVVGGGMIGSDVALLLAEQDKKVIITTRGNEVARGLAEAAKKAFFTRLSKREVEIRLGTRLEEIVDGGIIVSNSFGARSKIEGSNVVLAAGLIPNRKLFDELSQIEGLEVYAVGDCVEPRTIFDAIHEGYAAAYSIS